MAYQRILEERSFVEIAVELDCSLKFLYHHFVSEDALAWSLADTHFPALS